MKSMHPVRSLFIGFTAIAMFGCGGGSEPPPGGGFTPLPPAGQTGAVGIILTDAPTHSWDRALATITGITLLSDDGHVEIFVGEDTVDLLALGDYAEIFHVADGIPVGIYEKIRLQVSRLELQRLDDAGEIVEARETRLVANGKIDLNPRGGFPVAGDTTLMVQLDFDMTKSLKIIEAGASGNIMVRPVVFVRILGIEDLQRLTRVHGVVRELIDGGFVLCQRRMVSSDSDHESQRHCLDVLLDDDAGIFDSAADPAGQDAIQPELELTAIGTLALHDRDGEAVSGSDRHVRDIVLRGYVVQLGPLGTFTRQAGAATSSVGGDGRFGLNPDAGELTDGLIQPGTIVATRRAEFVGPGAIGAGVAGLFEGVPSDVEVTLLKSSLIVLDLEADLALLQGIIQAVQPEQDQLIVTVDASGDRCVDISAAAIYLVSESEDDYSQVAAMLSDLAPGMEVTAFGAEPASGCFAATVVLAEAPADD